jgi:hypothetical protein
VASSPPERPFLDLDAASRRQFGQFGHGLCAPELAGLSVLEVLVLWRRGHVAGIHFSEADVACLFGVSRQAINVTAQRALAKLRSRPGLAALWQALGDEPEDEPASRALVA